MTPTEKEKQKDGETIKVNAVILEDRDTEAERIRKFLEESLESISGRNEVKLSLQPIQIKRTKAEVLIVLENDAKVPDWVFCDLNLKDKNAGLDVAKIISDRRYPTDLLLYTQGGTLDNDIESFGNRYGNVWTANRDEIEGTIDKMVWRATTKLSDPEYLRGLVLSRATDTELLIDDCVASLFRIDDELKEHFRWGLLRNEGYGPGAKYESISTYINGLPEDDSKSLKVNVEKIGNHLKDIIGKRNLVAHGIAISDGKGGLHISNRLVPGNQKKGKSKDGKPYQFDMTRDQSKEYFYLCYQTDKELQELLEYLINLGKRRGPH